MKSRAEVFAIMGIFLRVVLSGFLTAVLLPPVNAQTQPIKISGRASCRTCGIQVEPFLIIGDTSGPGEIPTSTYLVRTDEAGRFYLSFPVGHLTLVFSPDGRFLYQIGRDGSGPGEFRWGFVFHAERDTAWIADPQTARFTAMRLGERPSPQVATWTQRGLTAPPGAIIRLRDGSVVINSSMMSDERIGYPLHRLGLDGDIISFGSSSPQFIPTAPRLNARAIAPSSDGGIWAAHATSYTIEHFNSQGGLSQSWVRNAAWFRPNRGNQPPDPGRPPLPRLSSIQEDNAGRVWILSQIADPNFQDAFESVAQHQHLRATPTVVINDYNRYFDTMIEVFDLKSGKILASQRVDESLLFLLKSASGGMLGLYQRGTSSGRFQIVVRSLRLTGGGGSNRNRSELDFFGPNRRK